MMEIEKGQYQHNGSGTAILMNKKYENYPARELFNDHKSVASIMVDHRKNRWLLAGIHANNGNGQKKWDTVKKKVNGIKLQYKIP